LVGAKSNTSATPF